MEQENLSRLGVHVDIFVSQNRSQYKSLSASSPMRDLGTYLAFADRLCLRLRVGFETLGDGG
jgi:hypothetical protein